MTTYQHIIYTISILVSHHIERGTDTHTVFKLCHKMTSYYCPAWVDILHDVQ